MTPFVLDLQFVCFDASLLTRQSKILSAFFNKHDQTPQSIDKMVNLKQFKRIPQEYLRI